MKPVPTTTACLVAVLLTASGGTLAQTGVQAPPASGAAVSEQDRRAQAMISQGESRTVAREYEMQALADPSDPAPKVRAALIYEALGDLDAAGTAAGEALKLDSNNFDALLVLGRLAARQQQWNAAATYFRRATALKPDHAAAQLDLGQALEKLGDLEGSNSAYATHRSLRGLPPRPPSETPAGPP